MKKNEGNRKPRGLTTKTMLICRIAVGGYLLYLSYGLISDMTKKSSQVSRGEYIAFLIAALLFVAVGILFIFRSLRSLRKGEYIGGEADISREKEEKEEGKEERKGRITFGERTEENEKEE